MGDAIIVGRAAKQKAQAAAWEQESVEISRKKAKSRWWHSFKRKALIVFSLLVVIHVTVGGWWVMRSGQVEQAYWSSIEWAFGITRDIGFEINVIRVEGLEKLSVDYIVEALGVTVGDPILGVSIDGIKERLEALPEVRSASVDRNLPDRLLVRIAERQGHALWQLDGHHTMIDLDGTVLTNQERDSKKRYLVLVGEDVPEHVEDFLFMLESTPELKEKVNAAVRVGGRRWNVHLRNGVVVKLPQKDFEMAWKKFNDVAVEKELLSKEIQSVDLRIAGKMFLTLDPSSKKALEQTLTDSHQI